MRKSEERKIKALTGADYEGIKRRDALCVLIIMVGMRKGGMKLSVASTVRLQIQFIFYSVELLLTASVV
jgi:ketopantoate hydroxymethyltransferase